MTAGRTGLSVSDVPALAGVLIAHRPLPTKKLRPLMPTGLALNLYDGMASASSRLPSPAASWMTAKRLSASPYRRRRTATATNTAATAHAPSPNAGAHASHEGS